MENIRNHPEFARTHEPLLALQREIAASKGRMEEVRIELSQLGTNRQQGENSWENFLKNPDGSGIATRRLELQREFAALEERLAGREALLIEGQQAVRTLCARLSRDPVREAKKTCAEIIQREILPALDQIANANRKLSQVREEIQSAGYESAGLPVAEFSMSGHDESYRSYIGYHFEIEK